MFASDGRVVRQLVYDGVPQPIVVVALDGVAVGTAPPGAAPPTRLSMPGARRAEIIVRGPDASVLDARLVTLAVDTGPVGDADPARPLARLLVSADAVGPSWRMPVPLVPPRPMPLPAPAASRLYQATPNVSRRLFFSQDAVKSTLLVVAIPHKHFHLLIGVMIILSLHGQNSHLASFLWTESD